ncbi:hypothetical protein Misp01_09680 [Microtetraspora sp. NBRC 13810]|uniref:hypothetical protein n=1 Tax=Microtetraspora sp. NBRC 13810 TaxID=3030990 RepID=UPI0024A2FAF9|nr:hypothetical protein [Microtetraspora sp. NBRC 13810]GLW05838.1 hypothetical protein Misp01_09680 [Microtetraspora sp. NBRC 13810]
MTVEAFSENTLDANALGWDLAQRRRFGELTARSWSDAGLRLRYEREPVSVLTEFGIALADGARVPALPPRPAAELVIESFDVAAPPPPPCLINFCFCLAEHTPADPR